MEIHTKPYNLQTSYGWQKIYAIYQSNSLMCPQPNQDIT